MSFLSKLFGGAQQAPKPDKGLAKHLDFLNSLRRPALALQGAPQAKLSRLGGLPWLPAEVPWPMWKDQPLAFLCQIDLAELPAASERHGLPSAGMLYFFYQQVQETWGFDPKDAGSWQVLYQPAPGTAPRQAPSGLHPDCIYREKPVAFSPIETYPDGQDDRVDKLALGDSQSDEYNELRSGVYGNQPAHQLFGYPSPIQGNDMDLECQLVTHGLYCGDPSGYQDPRAKALEPGRHDWLLLLQLDTDDATGMMWGDCGMLYFWIRQEDLAHRRFDRCWMILQCY